MLVATSKRGSIRSKRGSMPFESEDRHAANTWGLAARGVLIAALRLFSCGTFTPSQQNDLAAGQGHCLGVRSDRLLLCASEAGWVRAR